MLLEDEPRHTARTLLLRGVPAFLLAAVVSVLTHQWVHSAAERLFCSSGHSSLASALSEHGACPLSSAAATGWTFCFALGSFALYLRHPRNLWLGSLSFVNASIRLPQSLSVFAQLLTSGKARPGFDESTLLSLIRLTDPTVSVILMCFFSLAALFLTVTIIHDTRTLPWKWALALGLFLLLGPLEQLIRVSLLSA